MLSSFVSKARVESTWCNTAWPRAQLPKHTLTRLEWELEAKASKSLGTWAPVLQTSALPAQATPTAINYHCCPVLECSCSHLCCATSKRLDSATVQPSNRFVDVTVSVAIQFWPTEARSWCCAAALFHLLIAFAKQRLVTSDVGWKAHAAALAPQSAQGGVCLVDLSYTCTFQSSSIPYAQALGFRFLLCWPNVA